MPFYPFGEAQITKERIALLYTPLTISGESLLLALIGGDGEIRTLASVSRPIPLAGEPLIASWVRLHIWRQGWDSNPRVGFPTQKISSLRRYDHFGTLPYYVAVFSGNGETHYSSGGVSSTLDLLQTIIGNILRFVDLMSVFPDSQRVELWSLYSQYDWSGRRGSNSQQSDWKSEALPIELLPHIGIPERTQTSDTRIRNPLLYSTELLGHIWWVR